MNFNTIYDICQKAFSNLKIAYLVYASIAIIAIAIIAQFIRYALSFRNAKLFARTRNFVKKNGCICESNFAKYYKKIKGLLNRKEKDFVKSCRGVGNGYCGSYIRERVNRAVLSSAKRSCIFRNFAILYVFVLHAILVCFGFPWLAIYLVVAAVAITLFVVSKIFTIIRRVWSYFDEKKGYKFDEILCQSIGKSAPKNNVNLFDNVAQNCNFKNSFTPSNSFDGLCENINLFLEQKPDIQLAKIVGQNLAEIKNCGHMNSVEETKFDKIENSLNNYCS